MICSFLVTITLLISGPTKTNTQGAIKVKQYRYSQFIKANKMVKDNLPSIGLDTLSEKYPKVTGVQMQRFDGFKCNYDGEEYE